jgi:hypothetical protein
MRFFNTAGPVNPKDHYCLPPLARLNLEELLGSLSRRNISSCMRHDRRGKLPHCSH